MRNQSESYFHMDRKPRHNNLTYNSNLVLNSLDVLGNSQFTKNLLNSTEYRDHYINSPPDNSPCNLNKPQTVSYSRNPQFLTRRENMDPSQNRSFFSRHGANMISR